MIRFGMIGAGWRAEFFARIAQRMPDRFQLAGAVTRSKTRGEAFARNFGVEVFDDVEELLKRKMDFVVVSLNPWEVLYRQTRALLSRGVPILSETPCAPTMEAAEDLWAEYTRHRCKIQVAEQYFAQPYHQCLLRIMEEGMIGEPTDIVLSMMHGYHGINMIRRLLKVGFASCIISGKRYNQKIVETCGRDGLIYGGNVISAARDTAVFEFKNGTIAHYDFTDEQYFSQIRSRTLRLCGSRGEVCNLEVRYITGEGEYACGELRRVDLGQYSNHEGYSLRGITLNGRYLYRNPFEEKTIGDQIRLNDEELAMASVLVKMKEYVDSGVSFYGLDEACQDAYLSHLLTRVMETGETILTERKAWHPK